MGRNLRSAGISTFCTCSVIYCFLSFQKACDEKGIKLLIICPGAVKTNVYRDYLKTVSKNNRGELIEQA